MLTWMPLRPLLLGQGEGQGLHRRLAHVVRRAVGRHSRGGHRRDHHDVATAAVRADAAGPGGPGGEDRRRGRPPPASSRPGRCRPRRCRARRCRRCRPGCRARRTRRRPRRPSPRRPRRRRPTPGYAAADPPRRVDRGHGRRPQPRVAAVVDGDRGALRGQQFADAATDAPASTGDQGDTSFELTDVIAHAPAPVGDLSGRRCQPCTDARGQPEGDHRRVLRQPRHRHRQVRRLPDHPLGRPAGRGRPLAGRHRQPGPAAARLASAASGRPTASTPSATDRSATSGPSSWRSCCSAWAACSRCTRASRSCATRTRSRAPTSPSASSSSPSRWRASRCARR